jgi:hypothetical protein
LGGEEEKKKGGGVVGTRKGKTIANDKRKNSPKVEVD